MKPEDVRLLLEAAKRAVPRPLDPHPCTVRCPRVGVSCDIYPNGKCSECGGVAIDSDPRELALLVERRPELVVAVCESFLLMRTLLDSPAVMAAAHSAQALKGKTDAV
jgi:hypothetical protein